MKRKILVLLCVTFSFMMFTTNIKAVDTKNVEEQIRAFIYTFDDLETNVKFVRDLKDINNNYSFSLYEIEHKGFAITTKETGNIVDVVYEDMPSASKIYYVGPNTFVESITVNKGRSAGTLDSLKIKEQTDKILNDEKIDFTLERTQSKARKIYGDSKPSIIQGGTEVGIAESRMDLFQYNYWVNTGSLCGAYTAAAMLSYMDKYINSNYIKETVSITSNYDYAQYILGRTKKYITGTSTTFGVISCLNNIMYADYPKSGHSANSTASESTYKSKIKAGYPVILFLPSYKNNTYGTGHFVMAYRYVDYKGSLWFKAYDNVAGSKNCGWISRGWIENGIYVV